MKSLVFLGSSPYSTAWWNTFLREQVSQGSPVVLITSSMKGCDTYGQGANSASLLTVESVTDEATTIAAIEKAEAIKASIIIAAPVLAWARPVRASGLDGSALAAAIQAATVDVTLVLPADAQGNPFSHVEGVLLRTVAWEFLAGENLRQQKVAINIKELLEMSPLLRFQWAQLPAVQSSWQAIALTKAESLPQEPMAEKASIALEQLTPKQMVEHPSSSLIAKVFTYCRRVSAREARKPSSRQSTPKVFAAGTALGVLVGVALCLFVR